MAKQIKKTVLAAWQFDASQLGSATGQIQLWSAAGSMQGLVSIEKARELVAAGAYFLGAANYLCQMHDRIDASNRAA